MNFLSEAALDYPEAVFFASGRPAERFFRMGEWFKTIPRFMDYLAERAGVSAATAERLVAQYGRTNGLINELISKQLAADDGVVCSPDRIVVTGGCQEALALCVQTLCAQPGDVILARNPTYIGITGVADLAGVPIVPLRENGEGDTARALRQAILEQRSQGKRPKVFYVIPEFDNPTGTVMALEQREAVIEVAAEFGVLVMEDNPYGMFRFEGIKQPPMHALDHHGVVIYLGTYSKTLCPSARVGCAALPETLFGDREAVFALANDLSERKSFVTVNTSQINQALVGGILLEENCTLKRLIEPSREFYQNNRDVLVEALMSAFGDDYDAVRWNNPPGGFFLSLKLPFRFEKSDLMECVQKYGVIVMPMSFFALDDSQSHVVRLSYSNVTPGDIVTGVERFKVYVNTRLA